MLLFFFPLMKQLLTFAVDRMRRQAKGVYPNGIMSKID